MIENNLIEITQLADEFWNNLDKEKEKKKNNKVKPRSGTPQVQKTVFPKKLKINTIRRGSKSRFQNTYFHEKFKESIAKRQVKSRQSSVSSYSKTKGSSYGKSKVGGKTIGNKKVKKVVRKGKEPHIYSPIHDLNSREREGKRFKEQKFYFEQEAKQNTVENQLVTGDDQNIDTTLQLTLDDKETFNIHPKDGNGLYEGR